MGHNFNNFLISNINDDHFFTAGDCNSKTFVNIMQLHRLAFNVLTNKCTMFLATNDLELASGFFVSFATHVASKT